MTDLSLENRKYKLETGAPGDLYVVHMVREEALSSLPVIYIVAVADEHIKASDIVGQDAKMWLESEKHGKTWYRGLCTDCSFEGMIGQFHFYRLTLRPELWLLTQRRNSRIFQDVNPIEIIDKVMHDAGLEVATPKGGVPSRPVREFCVQYGETDFDFIHRLFAEEGVLYYFESKSDKLEMFITEESGGLDAIKGEKQPEDGDVLTFQKTETLASLDGERVFVWRSNHLVRSEKASYNDYNHENPTAQLLVSKVIDNNKKSGPELELYDYPGRFRDSSRGQNLIDWRMQSFDQPTSVWEGTSNVPIMVVGRHFKLKEHPVDAYNDKSFLITSTRHVLRAEMDLIQTILGNFATRNLFDEQERQAAQDQAPTGGAIDGFTCEFTVQEFTVPFRTPQNCPKPVANTVEPAMIVGPDNEEIHVDEFGRVKCHFFWDRESEKNDASSAWIRVMQTGFSDDRWGYQFIPRIGQEVVVAFQRGDPDRPIVIGAQFHKDYKPPYKLPDYKTQSGIKTHSSKDAEGYHEILFEDKAGEEFVRFQSQKDYHKIVKNKWLTSVGYEEQDNRGVDEASHPPTAPANATGQADGDCDLKIKNNYNIEVDQGDFNFKVTTGNQNNEIQTNKDTKVHGAHTETIDQTQDITITGACTIESQASIELKVGASSIKLEPAKITISSTVFEVKGTGSGTVDGGAALTVKGGVVNIN